MKVYDKISKIDRINVIISFAIRAVLQFYSGCIFLYIMIDWLKKLGILTTGNLIVSQVYGFVYRISDPALAIIRARVPRFGSVDLSPLILLGLIQIVYHIFNL